MKKEKENRDSTLKVDAQPLSVQELNIMHRTSDLCVNKEPHEEEPFILTQARNSKIVVIGAN